MDKDVSAYVSGGTAIAAWGYVSCPPRIGKRAVGLGTIETHHDQTVGGSAVNGTAIIALNTRTASHTPEASTHHLVDASGSATMHTHRIIGRGTRFETQFGLETTWASKFHGAGPWMSVQINGDWETVRVKELGTAGSDDAEAIMVLQNSFSEPLLKATHWEWYPLLTKGYGTIRSYGKRVVSNDWDNKEGFEDIDGTAAAVAGSISSQGVYGSTRFLTQLRTGYTITACGQTRMVNSIQSGVELTIDRPFTLGNREFVPADGTGGNADLTTLHVRGLTRLLPLWPRGVTVKIVGVTATGDTGEQRAAFPYTTYWKTFSNVKTANAYSQTWTEITDTGVNTGIGVYIKWESGKTVDTDDEWRLRVAGVENCRYYVSTEGERYMTDDNANPPVCYNHGKCVPANSGGDDRPSTALTTTGTLTIDHNAGTLVSSAGGKFLSNSPSGTSSETPLTRMVASPASPTITPPGSKIRIPLRRRSRRASACSSARRDGLAGHITKPRVPSRRAKTLARTCRTRCTPFTRRGRKSSAKSIPDAAASAYHPSSIPSSTRAYYLKPDHAAYNFRIAVHTVNDNLDLYAQVHASTRPTTASSTYTSVRESVPWAIDIDESAMACSGTIVNPSSAENVGGGTILRIRARSLHSRRGLSRLYQRHRRRVRR